MTNDPALIDEMLRTAKTIAVVGMSDKPWRASHNIGRYLAANAQAAAVEQTGKGIDLVDVFRASEFVPGIVDDVIGLCVSYLWLQDEVIHEEAVARARAAGVKCVQNDCIFREHAARSELHHRQ